MLGICILHACSLGGYPTYRVSWLLMPCVPCFIFISGFYGIKTTILRIIRIIGMALACIPIVGIVSWIAGWEGMSGWSVAARGVIANWFVWAYIALMCFASTLNLALDNENRVSLTMPIIAMALGWAYVKGLPGFRIFMPTTTGLGGFTFTMMIGTYLVGGLWRRYLITDKLKPATALLLFCMLTLLNVIGFSSYCSPISVLWGAVLFSLFSKIRISDRLGHIVTYIASSTFPIFVIHANGVGFGLMRKYAAFLCDDLGLNKFLMYCILGTTVFVSGLVLDIPRRYLIYILRQVRERNHVRSLVGC